MSINDPSKARTRQELKQMAKKAPATREEKRKQLKEKPGKKRKRLFPIWLRLLVIAVLVCVCFMVGTIIGYGVIGNGNKADVFKPSTWTHIIDLVKKDK
ncbi:DNA-directed RNA polymerase subunit beta [Fictibacillus gelatini]|uniref:DNA-directed RNA polymerase subunit beta n=1 Tax=Fictibacillus gelatini TaxID=225985 RepID=UPI000409764A|nr:DNA-directed RNA polymerase subunit beta [Fictibacillus gelatini]